MLRLLEDLPVELVGTNVLGFLSLQSIVILERACGSTKSHQAFMEQIPHCIPCEFPYNKIPTLLTLQWFAKRKCRILSVDVQLSADNPVFNVTNLKVDNFRLLLDPDTTTESLKLLIDNNMGGKVNRIDIRGNKNLEFMEQLSACTGNLNHLDIRNSENCMDWLTVLILSRWKLKAISLDTTLSAALLIIQTCTELTSIKLYSSNIDDAAVIAIAQHCPKLETLLLRSSNITWTSLVALSERGLPLEELNIYCIPYIPTADIAKRCSHALSCIRHLNTKDLHQNGQDPTILIPYITGLTSGYLAKDNHIYIPLLTQHCHKFTSLGVAFDNCPVADILSLCRANPQLNHFSSFHIYITDTALIELIHACPQIHSFCLTIVTDTCILALSEHCPQLQWLDISIAKQITEVAVLQLLQRCRKLTTLEVSSSSLSKETWTQLDSNTQKRVSRW